jgi:hypothetical protein
MAAFMPTPRVDKILIELRGVDRFEYAYWTGRFAPLAHLCLVKSSGKDEGISAG